MTTRSPHLALKVKRQRILTTPEGVALPVTLATRGARASALVLDLLLLGFSTFAFLMLVIYLAYNLASSASLDGAQEFLFILLLLVWFLVWNGYFMFFEMRPKGATPGKRAVGIRVASHDGGRLTAEAVIARNLLRDVELYLPLVFILSAPTGGIGAAGWAGLIWFLIFMLFPFFNKDSLRAGDVVAGTWVVEAPKLRLQETLSTSGAVKHGSSDMTGITYEFSDEELSVYGEYELQTLEKVLRDNRPDAIISVADSICRKIGWNPGTGDERAFLEAYYGQLRSRLEGDLRFGKRKADKYS